MHISQLPEPAAYVAWVRRHRVAFANGYRRVRLGNPVTANEYTADEFTRAVRIALHRRINSRAGALPAGRKFAEMWQTEIMRDARTLNTYRSARVRFYFLGTAEMRARYATLLDDLRNDR